MADDKIFGPKEFETNREYLRRLREDNSVSPSKAATLIALTMLMQRQPNAIVDRERLAQTAKEFENHPATQRLMDDPRSAALIRGGDGTALIGMMADKETARQREIDRYRRPDEFVREDAQFLKDAVKHLKEAVRGDGEPGAGEAEAEQRGPLYREMMKQLEAAQSLAESGVQLSGEKARALVGAVRAYNDADARAVNPGGDKKAAGFVGAMCVLNRYMPVKDFRSYCKRMNSAHGHLDPHDPEYVSPASFTHARMNGDEKSAREWLAESQERLSKQFTLEGAAQAAAIRSLSGGNPGKPISPRALDAETLRLTAPGSAFVRTMQDPKAREEFSRLAAGGDVNTLGADLLGAAQRHTRKAAQWQVNNSVRALTRGPVSRHAAAEHLANILAARDFAGRGDAGDLLTNRAFRERAARLQSEPAFRRLAERYQDDPSFRRDMNEALRTDSSAAALQEELVNAAGPLSARRDPAQLRDIGDKREEQHIRDVAAQIGEPKQADPAGRQPERQPEGPQNDQVIEP